MVLNKACDKCRSRRGECKKQDLNDKCEYCTTKNLECYYRSVHHWERKMNRFSADAFYPDIASEQKQMGRPVGTTRPPATNRPTQLEIFKCSWKECGSTFTNLKESEEHMSDCDKKPPIWCETCYKSFTRQLNLVTHFGTARHTRRALHKDTTNSTGLTRSDAKAAAQKPSSGIASPPRPAVEHKEQSPQLPEQRPSQNLSRSASRGRSKAGDTQVTSQSLERKPSQSLSRPSSPGKPNAKDTKASNAKDTKKVSPSLKRKPSGSLSQSPRSGPELQFSASTAGPSTSTAGGRAAPPASNDSIRHGIEILEHGPAPVGRSIACFYCEPKPNTKGKHWVKMQRADVESKRWVCPDHFQAIQTEAAKK